MTDRLDQDLGALLPQRGTARLLTGIVRCGAELVEAVGRIPSSHPLAAGGVAPSFLGLELAAQAAAAREALSRIEEGGDAAPRIGYLVRIREAELFGSDLPTERPLHVTVTLEGAAPPLAVYRAVLRVSGAERMRAILTTHAGSLAGESGGAAVVS